MRFALAIRLLAVLGIAALGGCAGPAIADYNTAFTSQSPNGLVIIGLKGGDKHITDNAGDDVYPDFGLTWTRTQPDMDGEAVSFHAVPFALGRGTAEELRKMHYTLYTVPPGRYVLTQIDATETHWKTTKNHLTNATAGTFAVDVAAGKIAYIGDFVVAANVFPAKIERHDHDESAAFAELRNYPNIQAPLRYVAPMLVAPPKKNATMFK